MWAKEKPKNQEAYQPKYFFIQFDANYDEYIDKNEFDSAKVDRSGLKKFETYDRNRDGRLSKKEFPPSLGSRVAPPKKRRPQKTQTKKQAKEPKPETTPKQEKTKAPEASPLLDQT